jgi:hypothetical protein
VLAGTAALAVVVLIIAFWLPSLHASQNRKALAAEQLALEHVSLPATFAPHDDAGAKVQICIDSPFQLCFFASGDPQSNVTAARTGLTSVASGAIQSTCRQPALTNSPQSCILDVPVSGGTLLVDLFPNAIAPQPPASAFTFNGTYVEVRVANR